MPDPTFPSTNGMPQNILLENDMTYQDNLVSFQASKGESMDRARYLSVQSHFKGAKMILTSLAQFNDLDYFFKTTIRSGSLVFNWKHPITNSAASCKMKNLAIHPISISDYEATFDLEVLP